MSFWLFLKIEINLGDLVIRWKPGTRILDRAGYWIGFKNYAEMFKDLGKIHFGKKNHLGIFMVYSHLHALGWFFLSGFWRNFCSIFVFAFDLSLLA
jgi:hypothetical protein